MHAIQDVWILEAILRHTLTDFFAYLFFIITETELPSIIKAKMRRKLWELVLKQKKNNGANSKNEKWEDNNKRH